ncbi:MAG: DUF7534 family protein [Halobacteriota archaeon]
MNKFTLFTMTMVAMDVILIGIGDFLLPPTQMASSAMLAALVATPIPAYWLVYKGGFQRLGVPISEQKTRESP